MSLSVQISNLKTCRICMDTKSINTITLEETNGWFMLFEYCFSLELSNQDQPRIICDQCGDSIKSYAKFKEQCYKSHEFWKSLKIENCHTENSENIIFDDKLNAENNTDDCSDDNINPFDDNDCKVIDIKPYVDVNVLNNNTQGDDKNEHLTDTVNSEPKDILANGKSDHGNDAGNKLQSRQRIKAKVKDLFKCKRCNRSYASHLWYRKHLKQCKSRKKYRNVGLNATYNTGIEKESKDTCKVSKYKESINNIIQEIEHFCAMCKYSSNCFEDWNKHLDEHWLNNDLLCMKCEFVGKDQAAIAAHRYTHYPNKISYCHICQHKARSQLSIEFHYRKIHLNKKGGLCSYPQCNKVFNAWRPWKKHERLHKNPQYVCDMCGKKYRQRHSIVEHLLNHTNPLVHVCDVCGKTFRRLRNLKVHILNVHTKPEPVKCSHCNRIFKSERSLRKHLRVEAMEKKWKCEFCPREFPLLSALQCHLKGHSDERPQCCDVCGSRYKRKSQLVVHMRNHTGYRPHKCVHCTKEFTTSNQLKVHSIIHTGILPYKCSHCEKAFRCKQRMLKHYALTHNNLE